MVPISSPSLHTLTPPPLIHSQGLRSKTRTLRSYPTATDQLPTWNFDGSSTAQAVGHDSDIYMKPVAIFRYDVIVCLFLVCKLQVSVLVLRYCSWFYREGGGGLVGQGESRAAVVHVA